MTRKAAVEEGDLLCLKEIPVRAVVPVVQVTSRLLDLPKADFPELFRPFRSMTEGKRRFDKKLPDTDKRQAANH